MYARLIHKSKLLIAWKTEVIDAFDNRQVFVNIKGVVSISIN